MRRTSRLLPVLAVLALGLAACSGGDDSSSTGTTAEPTTTTARAATTPTTGSSGGGSGSGGGSSTTTAAGGGGGDEALAQSVCDLLSRVNTDLGDDPDADPAQYLAQFVLAAASELDVTQLGDIGSADAEVSSRCPDELTTFLEHAGISSLRGI